MLAEGKRALGLSGRVPRRVDAATKPELLSLIDRAVADGWDHRRDLELDEGRAWRWRAPAGRGLPAGRQAGSRAAPAATGGGDRDPRAV